MTNNRKHLAELYPNNIKLSEKNQVRTSTLWIVCLSISDLSNSDLSNSDLSNSDLSNSDFSNSVPSKCWPQIVSVSYLWLSLLFFRGLFRLSGTTALWDGLLRLINFLWSHHPLWDEDSHFISWLLFSANEKKKNFLSVFALTYSYVLLVNKLKNACDYNIRWYNNII